MRWWEGMGMRVVGGDGDEGGGRDGDEVVGGDGWMRW